MSCIQLSSTHYAAILTFCARYGNSGNRAAYYHAGKWTTIDWTNAEQLAHVCATANARAYAARYREEFDAPPPIREAQPPDLTPAETLKAVISAGYQCSDWPDFDTSEARAILDAIRDYAIQTLPEYKRAHTWEIDYRATRAELDALKD